MPKASAPRKAVATPTLSVNKLAEYIVASPVRRRAILKAAKYPQPMIFTMYSEIRNTAAEYLRNGQRSVLAAGRLTIAAMPCSSDWQKRNKDGSIEALKHLGATDIKSLTGFTRTLRPASRNGQLVIRGLTITVKPELLLTDPKTGAVGALKVHVTKEGLNADSQKYVAAILHYWVTTALATAAKPADPKLAISVDIFREAVVCCPKATVRMMSTVDIVCDEIVAVWPTITP